MASSYSTLAHYGEYIQPFNFDLIEKGLAYKQNKFDANTAAIQSQIDQFANLDLAKDADKEYLQERLNSLVEEVNGFGSLDLSKNDITRNISNHLKQVLDDNVLNGYAGTQALRNLQSTIQDTRENRPDKYSDINAAYALRGAQKWLNEGAGTEYSGGNYTDFVDIPKEESQMMEKLYKNSKSSIQIPETINGEPTGRLVTKEFQGLDADEIELIHNQTLQDPRKLKQLEINAAMTYGRNPEGTINSFNRFSRDRMLEIESGLENAKALNDSSKIEYYTNKKNEFQDTIQQLGNTDQEKFNNLSNISVFLEKERIMGGLKNSFIKRRTSLKYSEDKAFFSAQKLLKSNRTQSSKSGLTLGASIGSGVSVSLEAQSGSELETNNVEKFEQKNKQIENVALSSAEQLREGIFPDNSELVQEIALLKQGDNSLSNEEATLTATYNHVKSLPQNKQTAQTERFKIEYKNYLNSRQEQTLAYNSVKEETKKAIDDKLGLLFESSTSSLRDKYNRILNTGDQAIQIVADSEFDKDNPSHRRFSDLKEQDKTKVRQVLLADAINEKMSRKDDKGLDVLVDLLSSSLGENSKKVALTSDTVIQEFAPTGGGAQPSRVGRKEINITGGTKTSNFLNRTLSNNIRDTFTFFGDDSVQDIDSFTRIFKGEFQEEALKSFIDSRTTANVGSKSLVFNSILDGKNTVKRGAPQNAVINAVKQGVLDSTTLVGAEGELESVKDSDGRKFIKNEKFLNALNDKNTSIKVSPSTGGFSNVVLNNNFEIRMKTDTLTRQLSSVGIDLNLESLNRSKSFTSSNKTSVEPIKYTSKVDFPQRKKIIEEVAGKNLGFDSSPGLGRVPATPLNVATPALALNTLISRTGINTDKQNTVKGIIQNSEGISSELVLEDNEIFVKLTDREGVTFYNESFTKDRKLPNEQIERLYDNMVTAQTVVPEFVLYQALELTVMDELQNPNNPTYTLNELLQGVQPKNPQ